MPVVFYHSLTGFFICEIYRSTFQDVTKDPAREGDFSTPADDEASEKLEKQEEEKRDR